MVVGPIFVFQRLPPEKIGLLFIGNARILLSLRFKKGFILMTKRCQLTGKGPLSGHNVSHSNRKTKRRFMPNLHYVRIISDKLGPISLRLTSHALRTIEHNGGLDAYLTNTSNSKLTSETLKLKKRLLRASAA